MKLSGVPPLGWGAVETNTERPERYAQAFLHPYPAGGIRQVPGVHGLIHDILPFFLRRGDLSLFLPADAGMKR